MRDRRDRERVACERCGREVTVRRDGGLMAHRTTDGGPCTPAAWMRMGGGLSPNQVVSDQDR